MVTAERLFFNDLTFGVQAADISNGNSFQSRQRLGYVSPSFFLIEASSKHIMGGGGHFVVPGLCAAMIPVAIAHLLKKNQRVLKFTGSDVLRRVGGGGCPWSVISAVWDLVITFFNNLR